ncbi:hypothetical protein BAMY6639_05230 [Bacillus amyloliquefaciens UMAF6639]|nr:hypothetical protein BAMY6639_05230 [Bacillus amyloliquefaciens UMAF6639]
MFAPFPQQKTDTSFSQQKTDASPDTPFPQQTVSSKTHPQTLF